MKFERPTITDHGSIVQNTFLRCPSSTSPTGEVTGTGEEPPKNYLDLLQDKFGECSGS